MLYEAYRRYCDSHTVWHKKLPKYDSNTGTIPNLNDYLCKVTPIEHSFESFKNNQKLRKIWIKK